MAETAAGKTGWALKPAGHLKNHTRCFVKSDVVRGTHPGRVTISRPHLFACPGLFLAADCCQSVQVCMGKEQQPTRTYTADGVHCFVWSSLSRGAQRNIADNHLRDTS